MSRGLFQKMENGEITGVFFTASNHIITSTKLTDSQKLLISVINSSNNYPTNKEVSLRLGWSISKVRTQFKKLKKINKKLLWNLLTIWRDC